MFEETLPQPFWSGSDLINSKENPAIDLSIRQCNRSESLAGELAVETCQKNRVVYLFS